MILIIAVIPEIAGALFHINVSQAEEVIDMVCSSFTKTYKYLIHSLNTTSDGLRVFQKQSKVTDFNTTKLVRCKMLGTFKPAYKWIISSGATVSAVGIFQSSD